MREFKDQLLKDQELLGGRGDTQEKTKPGMLRSKSNLTESTLKPQIIVRSPSEERSRKETQGKSSGDGIKRKPSKKMRKGRKTGREEERVTVEKQLGEEKAMVIDMSGRVTRTGDTSTEEDVFTLDEDLAEELEKSRNEEELKYREDYRKKKGPELKLSRRNLKKMRKIELKLRKIEL